MTVRNRGFGFLVPIGRSLTRQEEKNDVCLGVMLSQNLLANLNGYI